MVEIKRIKSLTPALSDRIEAFFLRSKPYDFCQLRSFEARRGKIREYIRFLSQCEFIYEATSDGKFMGACFFNKEDGLLMEFLFGEFEHGSKALIGAFYQILDQAMADSGTETVRSIIQRKLKKNIFIKWIEKYDKRCNLTIGEKLTAEWRKNDW